MFTGIIEAIGELIDKKKQGNNYLLTIQSSLSAQLTVNQSVAHNGACLSITSTSPTHNKHSVTAVEETLKKTNLGDIVPGGAINLERSLKLNERIEGHLVQGHIDDIAICQSITSSSGSWNYTFQLTDARYAPYLIPKGAISINGVSLTIAELNKSTFTVSIIPYTYKHTNFNNIQKGEAVNIEFDMVGKYILRHASIHQD